MENMLSFSYPVEAGDFTKAGEVSSKVKAILRQLGIQGDTLRRAIVVVYEAEINLVIHSQGGEIRFSVNANEIRISSIDGGPGIENVELALTEGYSTAAKQWRDMGFGAGMGLPNIKRNACHFEIISELGVGTEINVVINLTS